MSRVLRPPQHLLALECPCLPPRPACLRLATGHSPLRNKCTKSSRARAQRPLAGFWSSIASFRSPTIPWRSSSKAITAWHTNYFTKMIPLRTLQQIANATLRRDIAVRIIDAPALNGDGGLIIAPSGPPTEESLMSLTRAAIVRDTIELFGGRILDVRQRSVSREARGRPMNEEEMVSQEDMDDDE